MSKSIFFGGEGKSLGEEKAFAFDKISKQENCQDLFFHFNFFFFFNQMECTWVGFTGNNIPVEKQQKN